MKIKSIITFIFLLAWSVSTQAQALEELLSIAKQNNLELKVLEKDDFEFASDRDEVLAEEIKLILVEMINKLPIVLNQKLSDFLAAKLHRDYWTLSKTFSKVEGITLEQYFIMLRVEKAKELIDYNEMNFSEIAYELGYSNINHLSAQFKRVTGMSMTQYKKLKNKPHKPFDKIV